MVSRRRDLLVVDGYNVIFATPRYADLVDEWPSGGARVPSRLGNDPFVRAREALLADVAAYAQGTHEAVIVYDAAGNPAPEHPELRSAGVRMLFSAAGQSADELIEALVTEARAAGRAVTLVTSDGTIRATVGFGPGEVTCVSSALLAHEVQASEVELRQSQREAGRAHMTLADRLTPEQRARLEELRAGR